MRAEERHAIHAIHLTTYSLLLCFRNDKLAKEKVEIEKKLETFQREVKHVSKANTAKEIRVLKKVVQNLEVLTYYSFDKLYVAFHTQ